MPAYTNAVARPRSDLNVAIVQGRSQDYIWDQIFPLHGSEDREWMMPKLAAVDTEAARIINSLIAEQNQEAEEFTMSIDSTTGEMDIRKIACKIPDEEEMQWNAYFSVEGHAAFRIGQMLDTTDEYLAATALFNETTFGAATNSAVAYTEANIATISLIADIAAATERVRAKLQKPDTVVIPRIVFNRVRRATTVRDYVTGSNNPSSGITPAQLADALAEYGVKRVLIGGAYRATQASNSNTLATTAIWSSNFIWVGEAGASFSGVVEGIDGVMGCGGYMYWKKIGQRAVDTFRYEIKDCNVVRGKACGGPVVLNANAGTLIATQYS